MVVFTCGTCNEALKKQKVGPHWQRCRNDYVTCIDCNQDFYGDDYDQHVKCVTEAERYGGENFNKNADASKIDKGQKKQDSWTEQFQECLQQKGSLTPLALKTIDFIKDYTNIPRKRPKFINFIKNTCKWSNQKAIEEIWEMLEKNKKKCSQPGNENPHLKRKIEDNLHSVKIQSDISATENTAQPSPAKKPKERDSGIAAGKLKWKREIKNIIKENGNSIKLKKLVKSCRKIAEKYKIDPLEKEQILEKIGNLKNATFDEGTKLVSF